MSRIRFQFKILGSDRVYTVEGQEARTLVALHDAGPVGITALEVSTWALRTAHYVMKLRRLGLAILMVREKHGGPVPGWHGRYFLRSAIQFCDVKLEAA
jgi:hypothetical protein